MVEDISESVYPDTKISANHSPVPGHMTMSQPITVQIPVSAPRNSPYLSRLDTLRNHQLTSVQAYCAASMKYFCVCGDEIFSQKENNFRVKLSLTIMSDKLLVNDNIILHLSL